MKILLLSLFLFIYGCSLFKTYSLSRDITKESKKICLSGEGKGRLSVHGSRYVFSYENLLDLEHNHWILGLDFPLRNQETIELDWSNPKKVKFKTSIESKILQEQKDIDPRELNLFIQSFGSLLRDIVTFKADENKQDSVMKWSINKKQLSAISHNGKIQARFENLDASGHFKLSSFIYTDLDSKTEKYKIEFVLGECTE